MSSDAYQSSLLRFAIAQYRRGVDRHRHAFGRAHSTVKTGAELGIALVRLPLYVAVRASVSAGRRLREIVVGNPLPKLSAQARKLLNFSGFNKQTENSESDGRVVEGSDRPIFQTLVAIGACLSSSQRSGLDQSEHKSKQLAESKPSSDSRLLKMSSIETAFSSFQPGRLLRRWRTSARQLLNFERTTLGEGLSVAGSSLSVPRRITGVASDLETRSLVLVLDYSTVLNSLSAAQQLVLQRRIAALVDTQSIATEIKKRRFTFLANWIAQASAFAGLLSQGRSALSKTRGTERIDVSEIIQSSRQTNELKNPPPRLVSHRPSELNRTKNEALARRNQTNIDCSTTQLDTDARFTKGNQLKNGQPILSGLIGRMTVLPDASKLFSSENSDELTQETIEADVLSVIYVEHPLEKLLKWVDRVLLWIEECWQRFKHFAVRLTGAIFHQ